MTAEGKEGSGTMTAEATMTAETMMGTTTEDKTVISVFHHCSLTGIWSCHALKMQSEPEARIEADITKGISESRTI